MNGNVKTRESLIQIKQNSDFVIAEIAKIKETADQELLAHLDEIEKREWGTQFEISEIEKRHQMPEIISFTSEKPETSRKSTR